ncbi:MAG: hypothetical protein MHMPM18_003909 [Marteilia pararefringens]
MPQSAAASSSTTTTGQKVVPADRLELLRQTLKSGIQSMQRNFIEILSLERDAMICGDTDVKDDDDHDSSKFQKSGNLYVCKFSETSIRIMNLTTALESLRNLISELQLLHTVHRIAAKSFDHRSTADNPARSQKRRDGEERKSCAGDGGDSEIDYVSKSQKNVRLIREILLDINKEIYTIKNVLYYE